MHYLFDKEQVQTYLKEKKIPPFRAKQIQQAIYKESLLDINEITTLSKDLREQLQQDFVINDFTLMDVVE
jgi:23S rRNA (adenine2503-C2)-methyltransferase